MNIDDLSSEKKKDIVDLLKLGRKYTKIALDQRVPVSLVRELDVVENGKNVVSDDYYGRKEMRQYIISRRHVDEHWPQKDEEAINRARREYDKGNIEMCRGRDGLYEILYRIPRKVKDNKRQPYFEGDYYVER